jgi:hypothetical protein
MVTHGTEQSVTGEKLYPAQSVKWDLAGYATLTGH